MGMNVTTSSEPVGRQLSKRIMASDSLSAVARQEMSRMLRFPAESASGHAQLLLIALTWSLIGLLFVTDGIEAAVRATANGMVVYNFIWILYLVGTLWSLGCYLRPAGGEPRLGKRLLDPAARFADLTSNVAIALFWTGILSSISVAVMSVIVGEFPFKNGLLGLFILVMTLSGTFGSGLAAVSATRYLGDRTRTVLYVMQFALVLLCAPFVPFADLPATLQSAARLVPLSYGVDAFRSALMGYPNGFPELASIEVELVIVIFFGIIMPFLGFQLFQRAEKHAGTRGKLSKLS